MKKRRLSTKEKILQSTLRLLSIDQLESIKYDDIAKEAKISRTLIYHYFPDKDCLYKTLLGEILTFINEITSSVDYSKKAKESLKDLYTKIINAIDGPQNKSTKIFAFISIIAFTLQITFIWSFFTGKGYPYLFSPIIFLFIYFLSNKYLSKIRK